MDMLRGRREAVKTTKTALEAAKEGRGDDNAIGKVVTMLLAAGIDGAGPLPSARSVAGDARRATTSTEDAIDRVVKRHIRDGRIGGFATSIGGFVTMPVAIPANVLEFYVLAARMVGSVAVLRGYDVDDPMVRTAVLLTLVGSRAEDVLAKAGVTTASGRVTSLALRRLPPGALMMVNKAIGFRLLRGVGEKFLSKLGRGIPLAGGLIGAGIDGAMMKRIGEQARREFPQVEAAPAPA